MPYTFAHPGYSAYLRERLPFLSMHGLVFGSMTPDLDLIFSLTFAQGHTFSYGWFNILFVILPITFAINLFYRCFAGGTYIQLAEGKKARFTVNLPDPHQFRMLSKNLPVELLSMLTGILLHLFIDIFGHLNAGLITWTAYYLYGFGNILGYSIYYLTWFVPPLVFTLLGFYLLNKYALDNSSLRSTWEKLRVSFKLNKTFYLIFICSAIAFIGVRFSFVRIDWSTTGHYLIIYITGSLIFALLSSPILLGLWQQLLKLTK